MCKKDKRKRIRRIEGGLKEWYIINRLKCTNKSCGKIHNELPDCLIPYKQYGTELVEDVIEGVVGSDDPETEDFPSALTMGRWTQWINQNEQHINEVLKTTPDNSQKQDSEFTGSGASSLNELRVEYSPGWLAELIRKIYNSGNRI